MGGEKGGRKGRIKTKRHKESERAIFVELWYIYLSRFKILKIAYERPRTH